MSNGSVALREEPLVIPTYPIGPPEPNPIFYSGRLYQGAKGPVYPYPLLDKITGEKTDRTYKAVYLENEYLKICVLPEIGGRILSAVDKTNNYDFFYRQTVIKPALIGMLGAWISGGVEWNIPHHHRATTFMPVDYRLAENGDGSKTLWVGEIELRHRMKWIIGLTVYPGRSFVEMTIKLFNRTPFAHSVLYFTNAAVHVNPGYQVIFPPDVEYGTQHAKCEFIKWPVADNVYGGIDYTAGVDVSWWKNHPSPLSIFAFESKEDFFGGYDHAKRAGVAHFADHNVSPGKKFFAFANGPSGQAWDKILTDTDGPYLELMAGGYSDNQPDYGWVHPYETKVVTEYWYPVRELGGMKNANRDAALNFEVTGRNVVRIAVNATGAMEGATVVLQVGDRVVFEQRCAVGPERPFVKEVALPGGVGECDVRLALVSPAGKEVIAYRPKQRAGMRTPAPVVPPPAPKDIRTNDELYLAGLRLEQFYNHRLEPYPYYEEAVRRDPGDCRSNTALGLLYLKRGMAKEAEARLRAAVERATANHTRPKDGEAWYYLGVASRALGRREDARDASNRAAWSFAWRAASYFCLAQMSFEDGDPSRALFYAEQSLTYNALNTKALVLKAAALRKEGRFQEALDTATKAVEIDALNFWALYEIALVKKALGHPRKAAKDLDVLCGLMRGAVESHMELAADYADCGILGEAIDVLERYLARRGVKAAVNPLVHYTLGCYHEQRGETAKAAGHYALGAKMPGEYCFPWSVDGIRVLESAIRHNPSDPRAHYYLGNLLYDIQPEAAVRAWERSRELDGTFATVHRNLAFAYAKAGKDTKAAIASLQRAISCDGKDPRFFLELDELSAQAAVPHEKRLALLERNHDTVIKRDDCLLREIVLHVFLGHYDRAIELLEDWHFHIWEGGEANVHDVYVDAHLLRGRGLLASGKPHEALDDFLAAAEYPDRFEMGRPYDTGRAAEGSYFIAMAHDAFGDKAKAEAVLREGLRKNRKGTHLAYYQGLAWKRLGDETKAAEFFEDLVSTGRKMLAGEIAAGFFEKFGAGEPDSRQQAQAHYLIGLGSLGKGDRMAAQAEFRTALALDANHLGAHTMLAGMK